MKPVISVVVPAYNEEKLIRQCLRSLSKQDFNLPHEIILVDNNSTDSTVTLAREFNPKIVSEAKQGIIFAKQKGYLSSGGDIIAFLDADSIAPPNWLSTIYRSFSDPKIVSVTGPYTIVDGPKYQKIWVNTVNKILIFSYKYFGLNLYLAGGNSAHRKTILDRFGCFDTTKSAGEDEYGILSRLKKHGQVFYDPEMKIQTSGRRAGKNFGNFISQLLFSYWFNYFSLKIFGRRLFPAYSNIR